MVAIMQALAMKPSPGSHGTSALAFSASALSYAGDSSNSQAVRSKRPSFKLFLAGARASLVAFHRLPLLRSAASCFPAGVTPKPHGHGPAPCGQAPMGWRARACLGPRPGAEVGRRTRGTLNTSGYSPCAPAPPLSHRGRCAQARRPAPEAAEPQPGGQASPPARASRICWAVKARVALAGLRAANPFRSSSPEV